MITPSNLPLIYLARSGKQGYQTGAARAWSRHRQLGRARVVAMWETFIGKHCLEVNPAFKLAFISEELCLCLWYLCQGCLFRDLARFWALMDQMELENRQHLHVIYMAVET